MKIVFVIRLAVPIHSYRSILRACALRGHTVVIAYDRKWFSGEVPEAIDNLKEELAPHFEYTFAHQRSDAWRRILFPVRQLLSYRRYFFVRQSTFFRDRWMALFPTWLRMFMYIPFIKLFIRSRIGGKMLCALEHAAPPDTAILQQLRAHNPDVVMISVANMRYGSVDVDYMRAAKELGIKTVVINMSWDSLTTKGLIQIIPDIALVWNEQEIKTAMEHHNIPRERIRIVGAPVFDKWLTEMRATPREVFCKAHNIRPEDPIVLYVGTSKNVAVDETWLVKEFRAALDASSDSDMRNTQIIVRPHPSNGDVHNALNLHDTVVLPRGGALPDTPESQQLFVDCLAHSVAVVGLYTSAMTDAIIFGKPVIILLRNEYKKTQEEAKYFQEILETGAVDTAETFEGCFALLRTLLDGQNRRDAERRAFVEKYIRPCGPERPAGEVVCEALERL